ncbi:hypothetical protein ACMFMF_010303 [Clarireedia jacksonii]
MTSENASNVPPTCQFPDPTPSLGIPHNTWTEQWTPFELGALLILRHNGTFSSNQSFLTSHLPQTPNISDRQPEIQNRNKPLSWDLISTYFLDLPHLDPDLCPWAHRVTTRDYSSLACEFQYMCIFSDRALEAQMRTVLEEWKAMLERRWREEGEFRTGMGGITALEVVRLVFLVVFWEFKVGKILDRFSNPDDHERKVGIKAEAEIGELGSFLEIPGRAALAAHFIDMLYPMDSTNSQASRPVEGYMGFDTTHLNELFEDLMAEHLRPDTSYDNSVNTPFPSSPAPNCPETPHTTCINSAYDTQPSQLPTTPEAELSKAMTFTFTPNHNSYTQPSNSCGPTSLPTPTSNTATATSRTSPQPQSQFQIQDQVEIGAEADPSFEQDLLASPVPDDYEEIADISIFDGMKWAGNKGESKER